MVAGEVLLEGEAGLLSLFYNSTNKCWKVDLKMRLNWTTLTAMTLLPVLTVFTEDLKKYYLLTHVLTVNLKARNVSASKNDLFPQISSIESW